MRVSKPAEERFIRRGEKLSPFQERAPSRRLPGALGLFWEEQLRFPAAMDRTEEDVVMRDVRQGAFDQLEVSATGRLLVSVNVWLVAPT